MSEHERIWGALRETRELQRFMHELVSRVPVAERKPERNAAEHAKKYGIEVPTVLRDAELHWVTHDPLEMEFQAIEPVVIAQPGHAGILGLTIGCIRISRNCVLCLECGWLWCRIVLRCRF